MGGIYGPPGLGRVPEIFKEGGSDGNTEKGGSGFVELRYDEGGESRDVRTTGDIRLLIQSWSYTSSERVQENLTLSETEHIYTFGRSLPKVSLQAFVTHEEIAGRTFLENSTGKSFLQIWEKFLRARKGGLKNTPSAYIVLSELGITASGVAVAMSLNKSLSNEALIVVNIEVLLLEGFE